MGTIFSNQSPQKPIHDFLGALKSNEKNISIDLNDHCIPLYKDIDVEHYIQRTISIEQINALMDMPELQAKKLASIKKAVKAIRNKSSADFFKFDLESPIERSNVNSDLCYKCSQFLSYETNGSIIRPTTKCSNPSKSFRTYTDVDLTDLDTALEPVVVEINIFSGRVAIVRIDNMGSHYMTVDDIEEIKQFGAPTIGLTYQASQLVTKKTSASKKQAVVLGLDKGYRTWTEGGDIKIGLYQQPEPDAEEEPSQVENYETESNVSDTASVASNSKKRKKRTKKFVPRKRARLPSVLDCPWIVIMDYNAFEERGLDRKDLIEVFRVQPGLYTLTSYIELLRLEDRHGVAGHLTRSGDVVEEDDE